MRCWSESEWPRVVGEWGAYIGTNDIGAFAQPDTERASLAPATCRALVDLAYGHERPAAGDALDEVAYAVGVLAHESEHLLSPVGTEAETECYGMQEIRRVAGRLGVDEGPMRTSWRGGTRFELYPSEPADYRSGECVSTVAPRWTLNPDSSRLALAPYLASWSRRRADEAGVVDLVLQLLVPDGEANRLLQLRVARARARSGSLMPQSPAREETRAELSVGGQPDAVAGRAEGLGHRVHEADLAGAVGEPVAPGIATASPGSRRVAPSAPRSAPGSRRP